MCGRAAYSTASFSSAASALRCSDSSPPSAAAASSTKKDELASSSASSSDTTINNVNMSPGTSAKIFIYNHTSNSVCSTSMVWGLLPNNGTPQSPHLLPSDDKFTPSPHYIMFNARSETVDAKKSFHSLLRDGQSCIFAVDGYYEWTKSLSPIDKKKQPYFVKSSSSDTLLLAGLWSRVKTGRRNNNNQEETISTFTILTTEAHPTLAWLHPRQPCIIGSTVAREWLQSPSRALVDKIRPLSSGQQQQQHDIKNERTDPWECYPVTKKMNDAKYHGDDCTVAVKSKGRKLESYFTTSPSPCKRKKIEVKEDYSESTSQQDVEEKNVTTKCSQKDESNALLLTETINNEWSCHVCTFLHTKSKSQFLACEMCGSQRECTQDIA
ncbi:SOS response-associated peptidase (SRAP) [Skeletonema marinoi]|uniref:SOS response-associated peptidase (SRAP) n=2 Tax=Skeletonema marinoi TaxID=267567 RepID=A0AAD8YGY6_9STRA|nr:SOS response-associated peptidase (SRAP) [Skeletonema marinoi]